MNFLTLSQAAGATTYPGRGILAGKSRDGKRAILMYFIMGRSENSRNRVFVREGEGVRTQAFDPSKMQDPSLIIYAPVRKWKNQTIVTNGDQTDTIYDFLANKKGGFAEALRTREFEPDAPNFTPRVSALATVEGGDFSLQMSILKSIDGVHCLRAFWEYDSLPAGQGRFLHTYRADGNPIPSFEGEPEFVLFEDDLDSMAETVWQALNADNRVSLWAEATDLHTGNTQSRIINRFQ